MPGAITLGSDATGSSFDSAVNYVRNKIAAFKLLGTVEYPALWNQTNRVYNAAAERGDVDLATRAAAERNTIKAAQDEWERNNDRLESILEPLRAAGMTGLGALPVAAWVVLATIGVAAAMAAAFVFRDQATVRVAALCIEAVGKGQISAADCERLKPPPSGLGALVPLLAVGGLAWYLLRKR